MKTFRYSERHELYPNIVIISHNTSWGGHFKDHHLWMAELNGDVWDYNSKRNLISDCAKENLSCVVLRVHRNGNATQQSMHWIGGESAPLPALSQHEVDSIGGADSTPPANQ